MSLSLTSHDLSALTLVGTGVRDLRFKFSADAARVEDCLINGPRGHDPEVVDLAEGIKRNLRAKEGL